MIRRSFLFLSATLLALSLHTASYAQEFQLPITDSLPSTDSSEAKRWDLPLAPLVVAEEDQSQPRKKQPRKFDASINLTDGVDAVAARIDDLLDAALARDPQTKVFDKAVSHYKTKTQQVIAEGKDAVDYLIPFRGFGPSSEAGDIITGEKLKLKSRASAEYAKQKHIDEIHVKVVSNMMQIAMGLGSSDKTKGEQSVAQGMAALKELVGDQEAERTLELLNTWMHDLNVPDAIYKQSAWDVNERQQKLQAVMERALDEDPVLNQITKRLHKYNHRSKFARASAHIVQTTLGAAALTPSFVGPAAKAALVTFVMATGGPEQCKLLKELYLDKRFESRWKVINEEAHLALENYHIAVLTRNPVLLAASESIIDQMAGEDTVKSIFGSSVLPKAQVASVPGKQAQ